MRHLVILFLFVIPLVTFSQEKSETQYILKSIYFGGGSYYIDEEQRQMMYDFLDSIPDIRFYTITVHSHTDNIGGAEYNKWLSMKRSEMAIDLLLQKHVPPSSIVIKDFGQFNPVFDNRTWEGRIRNRRVDIIFWPLTF